MATDRKSRLALYLDVITTVAAVTGCLLLIGRAAPPSGPTAERSPLPLPSEPIDVSTAPRLGDRDARVSMIVYSDFECPYCGRFARETLPVLKRDFIADGALVVHFKNVPLQIHRHAMEAAQVAACAGSFGQFWQMHDLLFSHQQELSAERLERAALGLGIDKAVYRECVDKAAPAVVSDRDEAETLGIRATPTFLLGTTDADGAVVVRAVISGARPVVDFVKAIGSLLAESNQPTR